MYGFLISFSSQKYTDEETEAKITKIVSCVTETPTKNLFVKYALFLFMYSGLLLLIHP